jgi:mono/diheme cytochrome c family protein
MKVWIAAMAVAVLATPVMAQGAGDADQGKALWEGSQTQCRSCHGLKGEGAFGPPLAGRGMTASEFRQAARKPWGIMPAYGESQLSDADLANFAAYFAGLPKPAEPGAWRVPMPDDTAKLGQRTAIQVGCAQCHGATMDIARGILGGTAVSFEQFKRLVYDHVNEMPKLGIAEGNTPGQRLHMGNYNPYRISEQQLKAIYDWTKNDLGFRPYLEARLSSAGGSDYALKVENAGHKGKGPAAEDFTVHMMLPAGVTVVKAGGDGYKGVREDQGAMIAEWKLAKVSPEDEKIFTVTLSQAVVPGALKGSLTWAKPKPKTGAKLDQMNFTLR